MIEEFKKFIMRGNVIDLAVGIIIGVAFTAIVKSIVGDLINPIVGLFLGGVDLSGLFVPLSKAEYASLADAEAAGIGVFAYGRFLMAVVNFIIIGVVLFAFVKMINELRNKTESAPDSSPVPKGPTTEELLVEIRDLLKHSQKA